MLRALPALARWSAAIAACVALLPPGGSAQSTTRISLQSSGAQVNANSSRPSISADGRFIAFYSDSTNMVPNDTNGVSDIFVHDTQTGLTERVSVSSTGAQANEKSSRASISADGRYVGFYSDATNLVAGDTNSARDVFVHDRQTGATVRVSVRSNGVEGNMGSSRPSLSADGRFVAFRSDATNLVAGDTNLVRDCFLHDRDTDGDGIFDEAGAIQTTRVSVRSNGVEGNDESSVPRVSADGRFVAFRSIATNLVSGDTNLARDVFVHDTQTARTARLSVSTGGAQGNADSSRPSISADGRFVTFYSDADNLVAGDTNQYCEVDVFGQMICVNAADCFVRDRDTDGDGIFDEPGAVKTVRVSVRGNGAQANSRSEDPEISADGRFVTFWTDATNLFASDTNAVSDIVLHDRDKDGNGVFDEAGGISTKLVSQSTGGALGNGASKRSVVSADGRFVTFRCDGSNLVGGDTNAVPDVFLRDVTGPPPPSCTVTTLGTSTPACAGPISIDLLGCAEAGQSMTLTCDNAPPTTGGFLVVGFGELPAGFPVLGVTVYVDAIFLPVFLFNAVTDATGAGMATAPIPSGTSGVPLTNQFLWINTAACGGAFTFSASDALSTTIL